VLSRSERVKGLVTTLPVSSGVVARYVPGENSESAVEVVATLSGDGLEASLDFLGEDTTDRAQADRTVAAYLEVLEALAGRGLSKRAEVSVKLSAVGQGLPDGDALALAGARAICEAAAAAGTTVTVDTEDHATTDATLATVVALRADFPWVAAVLQSQLRRTEGDCRDLAGPCSRVRLCKGAYDEPDSVAFTDRADVDRSYVRCLKILFAGEGLPLVATHDPRLVAIAQHLGRDHPYELQMLYGVRPGAQVDLAAAGERMRVYVPYGTQWYGYFMRRLAERPANVAFFLRALATRG